MAVKLSQNDLMTDSTSSALSGNFVSQVPAAAWDEYVQAQARAHLLQLSGWGALKARFGWEVQIIALSDEAGINAGALVLLKRLPLKAGKLAYVPMGGYATEATRYAPLWQAIRRETGAAFLKLEPGHFPVGEEPDLASMGFKPSPQTIQPATTLIIDIGGDDEAILRRMNQGTRRKIRKSQASGIVYREGERADLTEVNKLMQRTGERNAFGVHSAAYFESVYDLLIPRHGTLLLAMKESELLAAIMVFALGNTAWYLYGASSRANSNLYATYGIQWAAIQWAKARGCRDYDLWGVPDQDKATLEAEFKNRNDGLWGVYGFKRGWGGEVRRSMGAWDLVWNPVLYAAYRAALKLGR